MTLRRLAAAALVVLPLVPAVRPSVSGATTAPVAAATSVGPSSRFVPVTPTRLLDTRTGLGATPPGKPGDGGTVTVQVTGRSEVTIPANASAVVLNVTATEATGPGFVTIYPSGTGRPLASSLNLEVAGQTIPNLVTTPLGRDGAVVLFAQTSVHLVADVFGYYEPASQARAGRFVAYGPKRLYDSRLVGPPVPLGGTVRVGLPEGVPTDAVAIILNVTVTESAAAGFWTVFPAGTPRPGTSNLNVVGAGQTIPNQVIVPVTAAGIDIFSQTGGHVVVDAAGWFSGPSAPSTSDGLFVPLSPTRLLDTREGPELNPLGKWVKPFATWTVEVPLTGRAGIPFRAAAVVMNTTLTGTKAPGYVTVFPAGQARPDSSNLNADRKRQTIANHTVSPVGWRGVSLFTQSGSHLIADVTGYYTGDPVVSRFAPVLNPPPPPPEFPGRIVVPRLGLNTALVGDVDLDSLTAGPGYWPGTAFPGQAGQTAIFGHRTSHTRPFRSIDAMRSGDDVYLVFDDMTYWYKMDGVEIVDEADFSVLESRPGGVASLILAACTPPGSTAQRYVVHTAFQASWGE